MFRHRTVGDQQDRGVRSVLRGRGGARRPRRAGRHRRVRLFLHQLEADHGVRRTAWLLLFTLPDVSKHRVP